MRKTIKSIMLLALVFALTGCFDDDSTSDSGAITQTVITGIENSYVKTAYVGEHLVINPTVEASVGDDKMEYTWLLLDSKTGSADKNGNPIEPTVIGSEKNLDFEVKLSPGRYQLRLAATSKDNGYTVYAATELTVRTLFSQGFYILKETADGKTEVDLLTLDGKKGDNLVTQIMGAPLSGRPVALYPNYGKYYINTDNDEIESANAITVTTDNHDVNIFRTSDFSAIFNRDNILYDKMDTTEQPYATFLVEMGYTVLVTSTGLYATPAAGGYSSPSSGKFGLPVSENGGSRHFFTDGSQSGTGAMWDEKSHSLYAFDYNQIASPLLFDDYTGADKTQNMTNLDCLHCGLSNIAGNVTGTFVFSDKATGSRWLYLVGTSFFGATLSKCIQLPAESHMAHAVAYSTNGASASFVYCVDGNKLYAYIYNSDDNNEVELKPEGIPSDETITYVANQYWQAFSDMDFDYLVVATQKGSAYKLYFYETNGGAPVGKPVLTTEGTGTVKSVRFQNDNFSTTNWLFGIQTFSIND